MEEEQNNTIRLRWYHVAATLAVAVLAIVAIVTILRRFDISLVGSEHTLRLNAACGDEPGENRYFGLKAGDFYVVNADKSIRRSVTADDAVLEIKSFDKNRIEVGTKNSAGEWSEFSVGYSSPKTLELDEKDGCKLKLEYSID